MALSHISLSVGGLKRCSSFLQAFDLMRVHSEVDSRFSNIPGRSAPLWVAAKRGHRFRKLRVIDEWADPRQARKCNRVLAFQWIRVPTVLRPVGRIKRR